MVDDYADWDTPAAHAKQIAAQGVPLLTLPTVGMSESDTITAGAAWQPAAVPVTQPGYELFLSVYGSGSAAIPVEVRLEWQKFSSLVYYTMTKQTWRIYAGADSADPHVVGISGPTAGDQLAVIVTNNGAVSVTALLIVSWTSRVPLGHSGRTQQMTSIPGFALTTSDPAANVLSSDTVSGAAAGSTKVLLMPLYSGRVQIRGSTSSNTNDLKCEIYDVSTAGAYQSVWDQWSDGNGDVNSGAVALPRAQCTLRLHNGNAGSQTLNSYVTAAESET